MKRLLVMTLCLLPAAATAVWAQGGNGVLGFERNDRVLSWQTSNSYDFVPVDGAAVSFQSRLNTSLNMATGGGATDRWYDSVYNGAEVDYRWSDDMRFTFGAHHDWNRDTGSLYGDRMSSGDYNLGLVYSPLGGFTIEADGGQVVDRRFNHGDDGFQAGVRSTYTVRPAGGLRLDFTLGGMKTTTDRINDSAELGGEVVWDTRRGTFGLRFGRQGSDRGYYSDYEQVDIEERSLRENTLGLSWERGNVMSYADRTAVELTANLNRRLIRDTANDDPSSTKYKNNSDGGGGDVSLRLSRGFGSRIGVKWEMDYGTNDNGVEREIRRREQTDVGTKGTLSLGITRADSLEMVGWIKRTRTDTPENVINDRDELKVEGGVLYSRRFSESFQSTLDFRVLETHYVSIDVSQSAQNKWMKTYLLSPGLLYRPGNAVQVRHTVNLYANHIEYDYDSDANPRSNISRRVSSETWIEASPDEKTFVSLGFMVEENEYGNLTGAGEKLPAEEGIKRFGDLSVRYVVTDWLSLTPRYIYAIRRDWTLSGDSRTVLRREEDQTFQLDCSLFATDNGGLTLSAKRIVRKTERYPLRIRNYVTVTMRYGF